MHQVYIHAQEEKAMNIKLIQFDKWLEIRRRKKHTKNRAKQQVWKESPSKERWKNRSLTYPGIAEAMAEQWGRLI